MRVLILGGSGMLGHKIWQTFSPRFDTYVTFRREPAAHLRFGMFETARALGGVTTDDALVDEAAERNLELVRRVADRNEVRQRVVGFYEGLCASKVSAAAS
jgi:dTDP-4-dehydrorhamnose reductase